MAVKARTYFKMFGQRGKKRIKKHVGNSVYLIADG